MPASFSEEDKQLFVAQATSNDPVVQSATQALNQLPVSATFKQPDEKLVQALQNAPQGVHPFYHVIGKIGGNTVAKKYGRRFYQEIGHKGGNAVKEKYSLENLIKQGLMPGQYTTH